MKSREGSGVKWAVVAAAAAGVAAAHDESCSAPETVADGYLSGRTALYVTSHEWKQQRGWWCWRKRQWG